MTRTRCRNPPSPRCGPCPNSCSTPWSGAKGPRWPRMGRSPWAGRTYGSASATPTAPGSTAPMRTPTGYQASTPSPQNEAACPATQGRPGHRGRGAWATDPARQPSNCSPPTNMNPGNHTNVATTNRTRTPNNHYAQDGDVGNIYEERTEAQLASTLSGCIVSRDS